MLQNCCIVASAHPRRSIKETHSSTGIASSTLGKPVKEQVLPVGEEDGEDIEDEGGCVGVGVIGEAVENVGDGGLVCCIVCVIIFCASFTSLLDTCFRCTS